MRFFRWPLSTSKSASKLTLILKRGRLLLGLSVVLSASLTSPASAAETVVLHYGIFWRSLPMADLTEFAQTGTQSARLGRYLRLANQEPAKLQNILNRQITTEPRSLDLILSSPAGDALLEELSRYIHNSEDDDKAALRTAIEQSTADDQKLSLLELLQNYPTEEVDINVRRAVATYEKIANIQSQAGGILGDGLDQILRKIDRP